MIEYIKLAWNSASLAAAAALLAVVVAVLLAYGLRLGATRITGFATRVASMGYAVPGMVLGLAYIFFFNHPDNPLGVIYGTMGIMVIITIAHFYTVGHLTTVTALTAASLTWDGVTPANGVCD